MRSISISLTRSFRQSLVSLLNKRGSRKNKSFSKVQVRMKHSQPIDLLNTQKQLLLKMKKDNAVWLSSCSHRMTVTRPLKKPQIRQKQERRKKSPTQMSSLSCWNKETDLQEASQSKDTNQCQEHL